VTYDVTELDELTLWPYATTIHTGTRIGIPHRGDAVLMTHYVMLQRT
jgi:hypothetical protein